MHVHLFNLITNYLIYFEFIRIYTNILRHGMGVLGFIWILRDGVRMSCVFQQ
jgi:hypothetical protein